MSSRSGELDPGLVFHLARNEQMSATQFQEMVNHASGLLGGCRRPVPSCVTSSIVKRVTCEQLKRLRCFCYQVKKWIGAFSVALGGLDTLVFAAGIGENAPIIRDRICDGLGFLGVELSQMSDAQNAPLILPDSGRVNVRVIRTDEELMLARSTARVLNLGSVRQT
jgi:acetate kinase